MTWLHHWWVNIGLNNHCQATSRYLDQCLAKLVCHYLGANELIYSQTVAEPTDFSLVVCMASNLIFRKQRYSGRRRSYIYPTCKCRIAISSTLVRGLCRQGYSFALATPGGACLAVVFCWSCRETVCYCTRLAGHLATMTVAASTGPTHAWSAATARWGQGH